LEPAGNDGILVRYVNSKMRREPVVFDEAEKIAAEAISAIMQTTPKATFLSKLVSKPSSR